MANRRIEGREQPLQCRSQYHQAPVRLQMRRRARELVRVGFDMFKDIHVEDAVEQLFRLQIEQGADDYFAIRQLRRNALLDTICQGAIRLQAHPSPLRVVVECGGRGADSCSDLQDVTRQMWPQMGTHIRLPGRRAGKEVQLAPYIGKISHVWRKLFELCRGRLDSP